MSGFRDRVSVSHDSVQERRRRSNMGPGPLDHFNFHLFRGCQLWLDSVVVIALNTRSTGPN